MVSESNTWQIVSASGGKTSELQPYKEMVKQSYPTLCFENVGLKFSVEYLNQSDYMASRDSNILVNATLVLDRSRKRFPVTIKRLK